MSLDTAGLRVLTRAECLRLLRTVKVGRVALSHRALPMILPVHFCAQRRRTHHDPNDTRHHLGTTTDRAVVAFEAEGPARRDRSIVERRRARRSHAPRVAPPRCARRGRHRHRRGRGDGPRGARHRRPDGPAPSRRRCLDGDTDRAIIEAFAPGPAGTAWTISCCPNPNPWRPPVPWPSRAAPARAGHRRFDHTNRVRRRSTAGPPSPPRRHRGRGHHRRSPNTPAVPPES